MWDVPSTRHSLLLRLGRASDQAAWDEFVRLYEPSLLRWARRLGMQEADAREVVQEVLISVAQAAHGWQPDEIASFRSWLATAVRRRVIDRCRYLKLRRATWGEWGDGQPEPALDPTQVLEEEVRQELFTLAMQEVKGQLPAKQWEAFWQTAIEARPAKEVAQRLKMSLGHVYVARCRAIQRLRLSVQQRTRDEENLT